MYTNTINSSACLNLTKKDSKWKLTRSWGQWEERDRQHIILDAERQKEVFFSSAIQESRIQSHYSSHIREHRRLMGTEDRQWMQDRMLPKLWEQHGGVLKLKVGWRSIRKCLNRSLTQSCLPQLSLLKDWPPPPWQEARGLFLRQKLNKSMRIQWMAKFKVW